MKKKMKGLPEEYTERLSEEEQGLLRDFFDDFDLHCRLGKREKAALREDFERALLYYDGVGLPFGEALERLDPVHLGGFYARPPMLWFPLDDAAKIYPLSMKHGRMSVFRLAVYLKEDVVPELLQMALNFTIKRFPSFATTLKKGFFWHYLDTAKRRFCAEPEQDIPCQPLKVSRSGSQSFRVLYWRNRISVEFFHVLTDGTGGLTFLKVLTAEYLKLTGVEATPDENLWDVEEAPSQEEFANFFTQVPRGSGSGGFMDRSALQMSGRLSRQKPCRLLHFRMNLQQLKEAAARHQTSLTVYLLGQMFLAQKAGTDELQGDVNIQLPVNMRKFYPSRTVRNFSMYCGIRLPIETITDLSSVIAGIEQQLQPKTSREAMSEMAASAEGLVRMLRFVPLALKEPVARIIYGFLGDKVFSNTLSNLGAVQLPASCADRIEYMDFVLSTAITNRAGCAVITFGDTVSFSISKTTADPTFEEELYRLLCADSLEVRVEGSRLYEG